MIDLHSHILYGIDDGAKDEAISIEMAKAWVADGVSIVACTPHILPSLYHNTGPQIRAAVASLQGVLDREGISLRLVTGADNHIVPNFVAGLKSGHLLSIADTRYVLVEPPHHVAPQRMGELFFGIQAAGYVPILTHPERLSWLPQHYDAIKQLIHYGVWMQITAGSLTGAFGRNPLYWATKMLDEGGVHILATDAHDVAARPPRLSDGFYAAAKRVGENEAANLVLHRPRGILENAFPSAIPAPPGAPAGSEVTNVDASGKRRSDRPAAEGSGGGSSRGFADRLRSIFKLRSAPACRRAASPSLASAMPTGRSRRLRCPSPRTQVAAAAKPAGSTGTGTSTGTGSGETDGAATESRAAALKMASGFIAASVPGNTAYKIGPQDVIDVSVFQVSELTRSVQVSDAGTVGLPLIGEVQAAGKTAQEVERDLSRLLRKYLQNPQVTVFVKEFNSQRVTIEGAVKRTGVYPLRGKTSLLQALSMAEGLDANAASEVVVFRQSEKGRMGARFDLSEIRRGTADDPLIAAGDVIVVGSSFWKEQFNNFTKMLPLVSIFALL